MTNPSGPNGNPQEPDFLTTAESDLMDVLLARAIGSADGGDGERVDRLMSSIRAEVAGENAASLRNTANSAGRRGYRRWFALAVACLAVVAISLPLFDVLPQNTAMAALDRTLAAEQQPRTREYEVTMSVRTARGRAVERRHRLFVKQRDFAICTPALVGNGEHWFGGRGDERWLVPRAGPVIVGREGMLRRELPKQRVLETPFLSVSRILERMKRFYSLSVESQMVEHQGQPLECLQITGTRLASVSTRLPQTVDVQTNKDTGFAIGVRLVWGDKDESRWSDASAVLVDQPDLPPDFFDHAAHHDSQRVVLESGRNQ